MNSTVALFLNDKFTKVRELASQHGIDPNLSDIEIIKSFLVIEYGYLLPQLEDKTHIELSNIELSKLNFNEARINKLLKEDLSLYAEINHPVIVSNGVLIDGYHRLAYAFINNKVTIESFVVS